MSRRTSSRRLAVVLASTLIAALGCPVHVNHRDSPMLVGYYRAPDGSPVRGAVAMVDGQPTGRSCEASSPRDTTDSAGVFRLPETEHVEKTIFLVPMDPPRRVYRICLAVNGVVTPAYEGGGLAASPSVLYCFQWEASEQLRASCLDTKPWGAQRAGRWRANGREGHYRALTVFDDAVTGSRHVLVQWVVGDADSISAPIAATLDLERVTTMGGLSLTAIGTSGDVVQLQAEGTPPGDRRAPHQLLFELGAPGAAKVVRDECSLNAVQKLATHKTSC